MLLAGVKVLDLTRLLPGAYCSMLMADVGAEVLKVVEPGRGDYFRWLRTKTMAEWIDVLKGKKTCCEPVNTPGEALENDHLRSRGMVIDIPHPTLGRIRQVGNPVKDPGATRDRHLPLPGLGEHTREVLRGEGCSDAEIDHLREEGVI